MSVPDGVYSGSVPCPLAPKDFFYIIRLSFFLSYERTWWSVFRKRVMPTKFDIYVFIIQETN